MAAIGMAHAEWFALLASLSKTMQWSPEEHARLMFEAATRFPQHSDIIAAGALYHLPKWRGSAESIEAYARAVIKLLPESRRAATYADIYVAASDNQYKDDVFKQSKVDWPSMKSGLESKASAYPTQWNIQVLVKFACLAQDKETVKANLPRLKNRFAPSLWNYDKAYACGKWALQL